MSTLGRLLTSFFLALCLVSCETVETGELVGLWQDEAAALVTCGDTFDIKITLEIREDAGVVRGTYSMGDTDFPFVGNRSGRTIEGDVNDTDKEVLLRASLSHSGETLKGNFQAAEVSDCAAGGTFKTLYRVTMTRLSRAEE